MSRRHVKPIKITWSTSSKKVNLMRDKAIRRIHVDANVVLCLLLGEQRIKLTPPRPYSIGRRAQNLPWPFIRSYAPR